MALIIQRDRAHDLNDLNTRMSTLSQLSAEYSLLVINTNKYFNKICSSISLDYHLGENSMATFENHLYLYFLFKP